ncbi:MASE1 domain-containing protein [Trichormus azollae]|jgi:signal transduction histidine kinase|uniref:MASE1 domain-containing protein n=1 Tax=Trichormus azollae TaxID=1164 RepID=UPI00019590DB|nr:MASE1 domain-containing protein [Trichormus azollae]
MEILQRLGIEYQNPRLWFDVLIIAISYYVSSWLVLKKMSVPPFGTPVCPGTGFTIGFLLLWGRSRWFGVFLGAMLANYTDIKFIILAIPILGGIGTTINSLITVIVIVRSSRTNYPFNQVRDVVIFSFCSLFTRTVFQSFLSVITVRLGGDEGWNKYLDIFSGWWVAYAIGILVFAPPILIFLQKIVKSEVESRPNKEILLAVITLCILSYFTFLQPQPLEYLLLPPLLWSAFQFGRTITTWLVAIISIIASVATSYRLGVFYDAALKDHSIILLQLFIGVISITVMVMLAIIAENHQYRLNLKIVNTELEQRVFECTRDLQESEAKAQELAAKAEAANQAKSAFIAKISHELRSPLSAVIGFSQLMLRANNLPFEQYENAGIIYRSGDCLLTLINHIINLSKIEAGKGFLNVNNFELYRLLDDLEDMLYLRASNEELKLMLRRTKNVTQYICIDGVKLRQILINLIINSIRFTHKGDSTVSTNKVNEESRNVFYCSFQSK